MNRTNVSGAMGWSVTMLATALLCANANVLAQAPASQFLPIDTALHIGTLPNGLRYYIRHNATPIGRAEFRLVVDAGSIQEDDDQRGMAHFVEHMAFNGTVHYPHNQILYTLRALGLDGGDFNAATSYDETYYMLSVPAEPNLIDTALTIMSEWAHGLTFDPKEVEDERGVVFSELRKRFSSGESVSDLHQGNILGKRYGVRGVGGTAASILHTDRAAIVRFYNDWYRPDLMTVIAVGDFDVGVMQAKVTAMFGAIPPHRSPRPRPPVRVMRHDSTIVSLGTADNLKFGASLIFPETTKGSVLDSAAALTESAKRRSLVGSFLTRILNQRLRALAAAPGTPIASASAGTSVLGRTVPSIDLQIVPKEPTTLELAIMAVRAELARVARDGVTPQELERTRRIIVEEQTTASLNAQQTPSAILVSAYLKASLARLPIPDPQAEAALQLRLAQRMSVSDIQELAIAVNTTPGAVVSVGAPKRSVYGIPDSATLLEEFKEGGRHVLPPYHDSTTARSLLAERPAAGSIVRQRVAQSVGVTEWILSNGARVLLKPTLFAKNSIQIQGVSAGGLSLASDRDYPSAEVAGSLVMKSGLGSHSAEALSGLVNGLAEWEVKLESDQESFTVNGSRESAQTLFDLLYLAFTAPRIDSDSMSTWKHDLRVTTPDAFKFAALRAQVQRNPRARPVLGAIADSIDASTALAFYRSRFGDAGHFTFVIVGDFVADSLRPLVERCIGGLPGHAHDTPDRARDVGIRAPDSVVRRVVVGEDSSSTTRLVFDTLFVPIPTSETVLEAVESILHSRVFQRLREELSGTYSPSVQVGMTTLPVTHATGIISFESSPDRANELQQVLFALLDTLVGAGVTPQEVKHVQEMLRYRRDYAAQNNEYWMQGLTESAYEGRSLDDYATQEQRLAELTPEMVNDAIRLLFNLKRYVLITSLPVRLAPTQQEELLNTKW